MLAATPSYDALSTERGLRFIDLGQHALELAGGRRRPPQDSLVAGARFELYSQYLLQIQVVESTASTRRCRGPNSRHASTAVFVWLPSRPRTRKS